MPCAHLWWLRPYGKACRWGRKAVVTDAGRDWGQEEKGTTDDEMAGWMGKERRWTWSIADGQGVQTPTQLTSD